MHFCRERKEKRPLCFPFIHRVHRCSLEFLELEKGKFEDVVEASRNNLGLHRACARTLVPHPHYNRPMALMLGK